MNCPDCGVALEEHLDLYNLIVSGVCSVGNVEVTIFTCQGCQQKFIFLSAEAEDNELIITL